MKNRVKMYEEKKEKAIRDLGIAIRKYYRTRSLVMVPSNSTGVHLEIVQDLQLSGGFDYILHVWFDVDFLINEKWLLDGIVKLSKTSYMTQLDNYDVALSKMRIGAIK